MNNKLARISAELCDIGGAIGLLSWDQEVMMPADGAENRSFQLATLSGIYHQKLVRVSVEKAIVQAEQLATSDIEKGLVREMKREYEKAVKIPTTLVKKMSQATSAAYQSWVKAKTENNFLIFQDDLARVLELRQKMATFNQKSTQSLYDAMLDDYEQGLTQHDVQMIFSQVKNPLSDLIQTLEKTCKDWSGTPEGVNKIHWEEFTREIVQKMGYSWQSGRMDPTAHPFEISLGWGDVRITTWKEGKDWKEMLMAAMHETGHALYELGSDKELARTHLAGGQGLILHESQSRLWENMVGRSKAFWSQHSIEWWRALNIVKPSPIRVLADEVTYGLHIILRFEIEQQLVHGKIKIRDLPELWNSKMQDLLGIKPKTVAEGVLQDVHWSHGSFGYFPTYFLGTMTAAQLWNTMKKSNPDIDDQISQHNFQPLREWLRNNIHKYGKTYLAKDLVRRVTGEDLNPKYFMEYLEKKFL